MKNEGYKDCQLCKHLDCDTEGHFICFEEYIEDNEDVDND